MKQPYRMDGRLCAKDALDFSWLNDAPAGTHGFLQVKDGHFVFEDGTPVRFWGVNLSSGATMPDADAAEVMAERIARAGANLVRLHYADNRSERSLIDYSRGDSRHLDPVNLDRLDYLIYQLKQRGIYVHIDLFVARSFLPGDQLDYPDDLDFAPIKQINIFNRRLIELQMEYARNYLTHRNPYTGLRYVEEPAVAVVQVMNENSIFWTLHSEKMPSYIAELDRRFNDWLLAKYQTRAGLAEAWTNQDGVCGLLASEDPAQGTVQRPPCMEGGQPSMRWTDPWEGITCPARYADHVEFLLSIQLDFSRRMVDFLRSLGVQCPINVSNHSKGPADNLGITAFEDVTEDNAYWNHPMQGHRVPCPFHGEIMSECDPRETLVHPFRQNLLTRLSLDRMADKPFIVGEWNNCYPTGYYADAMLMMASYASLQDWDGMLLYSYSHFPKLSQMTGEKIEGFWNVYDDPATFGQLGMAAAIFRKGWVRPAKTQVEVGYAEPDRRMLDHNWIAPFGYLPYVVRTATRLFDQSYRGEADCVLASGMTPCGDYTHARRAIVYSRSPFADAAHRVRTLESFLSRHAARTNMHVLEDAQELDTDYTALSRRVDEALKEWGLLSASQGLTDQGTSLVSDTEEIGFHYDPGMFCVRTPYVRGYAGKCAGELDFGLFRLKVRNERMTVHLIALDGLPLDQSAHLLLTAMGTCENTDMKWEENMLVEDGHAPILVDVLEGTLQTNLELALYPLNALGERMEGLHPVNGQVAFDGSQKAIYFEIEKK